MYAPLENLPKALHALMLVVVRMERSTVVTGAKNAGWLIVLKLEETLLPPLLPLPLLLPPLLQVVAARLTLEVVSAEMRVALGLRALAMTRVRVRDVGNKHSGGEIMFLI